MVKPSLITEKLLGARGLKRRPYFSEPLTHSKTLTSLACSCIYAWSGLLLVPSAHFIIHAYCTVATGNATISASTTLTHFISKSDWFLLLSDYSKLSDLKKWTCTVSTKQYQPNEENFLKKYWSGATHVMRLNVACWTMIKSMFHLPKSESINSWEALSVAERVLRSLSDMCSIFQQHGWTLSPVSAERWPLVYVECWDTPSQYAVLGTHQSKCWKSPKASENNQKKLFEKAAEHLNQQQNTSGKSLKSWSPRWSITIVSTVNSSTGMLSALVPLN